MGGHAACMGRLEIHTRFYSDNLKGRVRLKETAIDSWIILKRIVKERGVRAFLGLQLLRLGPRAGLLRTVK
jgi:hypothetical protein